MAHAARQAKRIGPAAVLWIARAALDFVFPPTCPLSEEPVGQVGRIAPAAWARLTFLSEPVCDRCGYPFELDPGEIRVCAACRVRPPVVARTRSALAYDEASRPLVLELKHAARTDAVATFAAWLALAAGPCLREADWIAPIPLHPARLRKRRFNQSALLARALAQRSGKPFDPDTLGRRRDTPSQGGKSASGRRRNMAGAFAVRPERKARVTGARVLLLDDVLTTGATLDAAARALKAAGARAVDAVTLLRVIRPRDISV
jgi:ComF family protein